MGIRKPIASTYVERMSIALTKSQRRTIIAASRKDGKVFSIWLRELALARADNIKREEEAKAAANEAQK